MLNTDDHCLCITLCYRYTVYTVDIVSHYYAIIVHPVTLDIVVITVDAVIYICTLKIVYHFVWYHLPLGYEHSFLFVNVLSLCTHLCPLDILYNYAITELCTLRIKLGYVHWTLYTIMLSWFTRLCSLNIPKLCHCAISVHSVMHMLYYITALPLCNTQSGHVYPIML